MSRTTPCRRSIPYILLTLIASIWTIPELAAEGKADELSTAHRAAQAAYDTHVESGMIGLRAAVEACFERAAHLRKLSAAEYCYTLDSSAIANLSLATPMTTRQRCKSLARDLRGVAEKQFITPSSL